METVQLGNPPIKHLLVDLDGTLLGNRNFPLSLDFLRRAMGNLRPHGGFRRSLRALLAIQKEFDRPSEELTNDMRVVGSFARQMNVSVEKAREILREGVLTIFPTLKRHFYPMPGAKDFLDWAKGRYTLTLATNPVWPEEIIKMRVEWAGLDPAIFSYITDVRKMRACKPAAQYYREILEHRGFKAGECMLIGNEMKMDLPATCTGIRVYIVTPPGPPHKTITRAHKLKTVKGDADAWSGPFFALREALEKQSG